MGNVRDRWFVTDRATGAKAPTSRHGQGKRYLARYRDEAGRDHTRAFDKKAEAANWLATETAKIVRGDWVDPSAGKVTLRRFYDDWSPNQVWLSNTRENADHAMKMCTFADVPLRSLRRSHVEAWVKRMSTELAATTIDTRVTIVRGVLRAAVADRLIPRDPSEGVVLPRKRKAEAAMRIPTSEEVGQLLASADATTRPGFSTLVALAAFAGLRKGELLGLQVGDIDFLRRTLRVTRQLQRAKTEDTNIGKNLADAAGSVTVVVRPPKYGSERTVHLPDQVVKLLSAHIAAHTPEGDVERWLFNSGGLPIHDNIADYRWRMTRKAAHLEAVNLHDLRHYFASGLIAAGCDVVTVQRALGHATATTTLNTYSHLWPNAEDRTRAAAAGLFQEATSTDGDQLGTEEAN